MFWEGDVSYHYLRTTSFPSCAGLWLPLSNVLTGLSSETTQDIYNKISFQYQQSAVRTWFAINISQTCRLSRVNVAFKGFLDLKYIKCIDLLNMTWHCYDLPHYTALHTIKMLLMLMCISVPAVPDCLSMSVCVWREAAEVVQCSGMWSVAVGGERRLLWQGSRLQRTQSACSDGPGL